MGSDERGPPFLSTPQARKGRGPPVRPGPEGPLPSVDGMPALRLQPFSLGWQKVLWGSIRSAARSSRFRNADLCEVRETGRRNGTKGFRRYDGGAIHVKRSRSGVFAGRPASQAERGSCLFSEGSPPVTEGFPICSCFILTGTGKWPITPIQNRFLVQ
jgi:hypothetical protein